MFVSVESLLGDAMMKKFIRVALIKIREVVMSRIELYSKQSGLILGLFFKFLIEDLTENGFAFLKEILLAYMFIRNGLLECIIEFHS
jgi:hypothetical protein